MKLSRIFSTLVAGAALLAASAVVAAPLPNGMTTVSLATITNDRDTSVSTINLMLNKQSRVRGIYMRTLPSADSAPAMADGQVYWLSGIESDSGVVLGQGQGHKAIILSGNIQPRYGRGSLVVHYLSNGLFGSYDTCRIGLRRTAAHDWQLVNTYNGQPIRHIQVQTWTLGISTLTNVCPA